MLSVIACSQVVAAAPRPIARSGDHRNGQKSIMSRGGPD